MPEDTRQQSFPHNIYYDPSNSTTWKKEPTQTFDIGYAGGFGARGIVGDEQVTVGGVAARMQLGVATNIVGNAISSDFDGILGLGFQLDNNIVPIKQPTFMELIQPHLDASIFACNFNPSTPTARSLSFGHADETLFNAADKLMVPVDSSLGGYWLVHGLTFSAGGQPLGAPSASDMVFDTGGLATKIPSDGVAAYWAQVSGAVKDASINKWVFPCGAVTPDLTFNFASGGSRVILGAVLNPSTTSNQVSASGACIGGLQEPPNSPTGSSGGAFFQAFFTIWNQSAPSITFAPYL